MITGPYSDWSWIILVKGVPCGIFLPLSYLLPYSYPQMNLSRLSLEMYIMVGEYKHGMIQISTYQWTHWVETKWPPFCRRYFQIHFLGWKSWYLDSNFIEICLQESNWQYAIIGSDNGWALNNATSHYLNQWRPSLLAHICIIRSQWQSRVF